jgi:hypothetical protein
VKLYWQAIDGAGPFSHVWTLVPSIYGQLTTSTAGHHEAALTIESKVFDLESNAFINLQTGKVIVLLQDNDDSRKITLGRRFINMG